MTAIEFALVLASALLARLPGGGEDRAAQVDMNALDGRARLVELARPALESIPPGVFRDMMFGRLETLARHRLSAGRETRAVQPRPGPRR